MEGFCRACLSKFNEPTELLQYCESNRRLFVYCTGLQVKRNDTFTFQLCKECYLNLKFSCKFKKQCRTSNKKFKTFLALKENGECIDFNTYLKNVEDTLSLRLPIASSSSTPAHQKIYDDDDNESTCTSIQNFMSDMLQGEEMLPTEARIIREVIQEEADILDDSLDSHWLQDDVSIEDDLGMDFNFAGFSTPHSINNDHCYTPRRITNDKEDDPYYYTSKDTVQNLEGIQVPHDHKDMPLLDIAENNTASIDSTYDNIIEPNNQATNTQYQNDMPLLDDCDIKLDGIVEDFITMDDLETGYDIESTVKPKNKDITIILNKGVASKVIHSPLTNELDYYMNKVELNRMSDTRKLIKNKNNIDTVPNKNKIDTINQSMPTQDFDQYMGSAKLNLDRGESIEHVYSPVKCELEQYINKAELKTNIAPNQNKNSKKYNEKCSIDRNLEIALKNDDSQEFALDQLLISPQVSIRSGASTPTINNILFGTLTPRDTVVPDLGNNAVVKEPKPTDFIEEFLIDDCKRLITKKESKEVERRFQIVKDLKKLKESKAKTQRKIIKGNSKSQEALTKFKYNKQNKRNRGYKDIKKLKDKLKFENYKHSETSDCEMLDSEQKQSITEAKLIDNKQAFEFVDENLYKTSDSEMSDTVQSHRITAPINIKETVHFETKNHCETSDSEMLNNKEVINQIPKNDDDLDISISNLLRFDDNQSVDLNISIASDFLKDDTLEEHNNVNNLKDPEHLFKMPFSPPDNKYDLDKNLCKICDKTYKNKCALKIHFIKTHKQQLPKANRSRNVVPKICPKCGKRFRDSSNFHKHMKTHDEPDYIKCEYCTLEFPSRGRFKQHMKTHESEIDKKANEVLVNDEQDTDKDGDGKSREGKQTKTFVCTTCGKELKSSGNYHVHLRRHNKNYTTKCEICQKGFFRKCDLDVHMATHNNVYPFECQYCPKKYRSRRLLVGHLYRHMGKEIFKCDVCNRQFISRQYLKQHYRTDMCTQNRKALDEGQEAANVTVTYKPLVYKPSKTTKEIGESPENVTKDGLNDTMETDCQESIEEEVNNKLSSCSSTEDIAANSS